MGGKAATQSVAHPATYDDEAFYAAKENAGDEADSKKIHAALRLYFSCTDIKECINEPQPNTFLVLKEKKGYASWSLSGQTETVYTDKSPQFSNHVKLSYYPEEIQRMLLELYEVTTGYKENAQNKLLCSVEFNLYELVKSKSQSLTLRFKQKSKQEDSKDGFVNIIYEFDKTDTVERIVHSEVSIVGCQKNADYQFTLARVQHIESAEDAGLFQKSKILVYNSFTGDYHSNEQIYIWKPMEISAAVLALDNFSTPLRLVVSAKLPKDEETNAFLKEEEKSGPKIIADEEVTIDQMTAKELSFLLCKDGVTYGNIKLSNTVVKERFAFADYTRAGLSLHLTASIDYAITNFKPSDARSFHSSDLAQNPYANVLKYIGNAILAHDPVKKICALGHGARIPGIGVTHCFAINGNILSPEIDGLTNVFKTYFTARDTIEFSGPTKLGEILRFTGDAVEDYTKGQFINKKKYFIILCVVDCAPSDLEETKDELVRCSNLPMSIVVVGLRNNMCRVLEEVIHPSILIYSNKQKANASRVACQYISYETMKQNIRAVTQGVLAEIQREVLEYCYLNGIRPEALFAATDTTKKMEPAAPVVPPAMETLGQAPPQLDANGQPIPAPIQAVDPNAQVPIVDPNAQAQPIDPNAQPAPAPAPQAPMYDENGMPIIPADPNQAPLPGGDEHQIQMPDDEEHKPENTEQKREDVEIEKEIRPYGELMERIKKELNDIIATNKKLDEQSQVEEGKDYFVEGTSRALIPEGKPVDESPAGNPLQEGASPTIGKTAGDAPLDDKGMGATQTKTIEKTEVDEEDEQDEEEEEEIDPREEEVPIETVEPLLLEGFPTRKIAHFKAAANDKGFKNVLLEAISKMEQ